MNLSTTEKDTLVRVGYGSALNSLEINERGLDSFHTLIQAICTRCTSQFSGRSHRTRAVITSQPESANAWAWDHFFGKGRHAVIFQDGLINSIRELAAQADPIINLELSDHGGGSSLRDFWGSLPNDAQHREAFAELLGHAALAFLAHHEMAHIALNHQSVRTLQNAPPAIDEHLALQDLWGELSDLRSQALELDADIHAMELTRRHFELNRTQMDHSPVSGEPATCAVWNSFVGTSRGIRFLIVAGAWLALLALDARKFHPKYLKSRTHPMGAMRMAVLIHLENSLSVRQTQGDSTVQTAAADLALCSYGIVLIAKQRLLSLGQGSPASSLQTVKEPLEVAKRNSGLGGIFSHWKAVEEAAKTLAGERASIEVELARNRRVSSDFVINWFE